MTRHIVLTGILILSSAPVYALDQACEGEICYHQPGRQITFLLNEGCTVGGSLQVCTDAAKSAMEVWNSPECTDMELFFGGTTPRVDIGYSQENPDDNINLIYVLDSGWPHAQTNPRVSTMAYDGQSGAVLDYDIEVNNQYLTPTEVDLHNILARDFGMALGFEKNSNNPDSIMWVSSDGVKRILSPDDTQAFCALYPLSDPQPPRSGCSCHGGSTVPGSPAFVLLLALLSIVRRRGRRSRRDRSPGGRIRCLKTR